ncbi:hypothetical protein HK097_008680 [Rhizophlyctis rosea]|uniref:DH domain-containing protein n=1 Tax=Rhizophlyctis rosea TaxID=64517 RepID=A0AAD5X0Y4_9FUNG|nr:hypothetical protein HK097_008680 [Rhizophlyctis rosea]
MTGEESDSHDGVNFVCPFANVYLSSPPYKNFAMGPCNPLGQPKGRLWRALRDKAEAKQLDRIFAVLGNLMPDDKLCTGHYNFLNDLARSERKAKEIEEYLTRQKRKVALGRARGFSEAPPFDTRPADPPSTQPPAKRTILDDKPKAPPAKVPAAAKSTTTEAKKKAIAVRKETAPITTSTKVRKTPTPHDADTKKPAGTRAVTRPSSATNGTSRVRSPIPGGSRSGSVSSTTSQPPLSPNPITSPITSPTSATSRTPSISPLPSVEDNIAKAEQARADEAASLEAKVQEAVEIARRESMRPPPTPRTPRVTSIVGMFGSFFPSSAPSPPIPAPEISRDKTALSIDTASKRPEPIVEEKPEVPINPSLERKMICSALAHASAQQIVVTDEVTPLRNELAEVKAELARAKAREAEINEERDAELEAYRSQLALAKEESSTLRLIHEQTLSQHRDDVAVFEMRISGTQEELDRSDIQRKTLELELARVKRAVQSMEVEVEELRNGLKGVTDQKEVLQQVSEELTQEMVNMKMRSKEEVRELTERLERRDDEIRVMKRTLQEQDDHATSKFDAFAATRDTELNVIRQQLQAATDALHVTTEALTQTRAELTQASTEMVTLRAENATLHTDLDRSESKFTDVSARLKLSVEDAKATGDRRIAEITERLQSVEDEKQAAVQELRETRKKVLDAESGAEKKVADLRREVEREVTREREKVGRLEAEVETLESALEKQKSGFMAHIDQIEEHTAVHRRQWERDMSELRSSLSSKIEELESVRKTLGSAIDDLRAEKQQKESEFSETIKEWEVRYRNAQGDVERAKNERVMVEKKWKESQDECLVLVNELDRARREVEDNRRELEEVRGPLLEEMDRIREEGDKREEDAEVEKKELLGRIEDLERALARALENHTSNSNDQARLLRERGEEITRLNATLLETTDALDGARQELTGLRVALQTAISRREEMTKIRDRLKEDVRRVEEEKEEKVGEAVRVIEEKERRIGELESETNRLCHRLSSVAPANVEVDVEEVIRKACETAEGRQTVVQLLGEYAPNPEKGEILAKGGRRWSVAPSIGEISERRLSVATVRLAVLTGRDGDGGEGRKGAELNRADVAEGMQRESMESVARTSTSSRRSTVLSPLSPRSSMSLNDIQLGTDIRMSPTGELFEDVLKEFEETSTGKGSDVGADVDGAESSFSPVLSRPTSPRSPDGTGFDTRIHFYEVNDTLTTFPSLPRHNQLTHLYLDHTGLNSIPGSAFAFCPKLVVLDLTGNVLEGLPRELGTLVDLRELYAGGNAIKEVPREVEALVKLESLDLGGNRLWALPPTLFARMLRLEHIDVSHNQLTGLPPSLGLLSDRLQSLFVEGNNFDYSFQRLLHSFIAATSGYSRPSHMRTDIPSETLTQARINAARRRHIMIGSEGEDGMRDRRSGGSLRSSVSNESLASSVAGFGGSFIGGWESPDSDRGLGSVASSRVPSFDSGIADMEKGRGSPRFGRHGNASTEYLPTPLSSPLTASMSAAADFLDATSLRRRPFPTGGRIQLLRILAHLRDLYDLDPTIKHPDTSVSQSDAPQHPTHTRHPSATSSISTDVTAVDGDEVEKLRKKQSPERRRQIVEEILQTEKTYVAQLQALVEIYVTRLEQGDLLSGHDCAAIFANVRSILLVHSQHLLPDLQKAAQQPTQLLGGVFVQIAPFLKMYSLYYNNFETANSYVSQLEIICGLSSLHSKSALQTLDKSHGHTSSVAALATGKKAAIKKLRHFLKHAKLHPAHSQINLQAFLILPVQRLPRYKMLLDQLLDATPSTHPDYSDLRKAAEEVRRRVAECNENKRDAEEREKGLSVVSRIRVVEGRSLGAERVRHFSVGRKFLREGVVRVVKFVEWRGEGRRVDVGIVGRGRGVVQEIVGGLLETRVGDEGASNGGGGGGAAMFGVGRLLGKEFRFFLFSDVLCWCRAEVESEGGAGGGTGHELVRTFEAGTGRKAEMVEIVGADEGRGVGVGVGGREAVVRIGDWECVLYVRGPWEEMAGWVRAINGGR